ncbi:MAG: DUF2156 domain-containing protein [Lachnospiraceae bacterium]
MEIVFKRPVHEDKELITGYLKQKTTRSCERTFGNIFLWARFYQGEFAVVEDMLVLSNGKDPRIFQYPQGSGDVKKCLDMLMKYCEEHGQEFQMNCVTKEQFEELESLYPGEFEIEYQRDIADYVYESEKLRMLSGKKYHSKKNHVNKFKKLYPDWQYEKICEDNVEECFQMLLHWKNIHECQEHEEKNAESCVAANYLRLFQELDVCGGLLRVEGKVVAFTVGEKSCDDTMVVHIEKALTEYEGAYTMINQQFVEHECADVQYINREEDTGDEGLRAAKLSYKPVFLLEKGRVKRKTL